MSWIKDLAETAIEAFKFIALGEKPKVQLEEPLDELKTEREAQKMADRRRERAAKRNGGK